METQTTEILKPEITPEKQPKLTKNIKGVKKTKKKAKQPIKVCNKYNLGENQLFKHFIDTNEWTKVFKPIDSDYTHITERGFGDLIDICDCITVNKIPGMGIIAHKTEHFELINQYVKENPEIEGKYFPKTFILPDQLEEYKSSHKVT